MNNEQLELKYNILNNFINTLLNKLAIDYMKLKMNDKNNTENNLIIKNLDYLLKIVAKKVNIKSFSAFNLFYKNEISEQTEKEYYKICSLFKKNFYYQKVFRSFLFSVLFLCNEKLQDEIFYDLYKNITNMHNNFVVFNLLNEIFKKYEMKNYLFEKQIFSVFNDLFLDENFY